MTTGPIAGSKTYQYCTNCTGSTQSVTVSLQATSCTDYQNGINGYGDYVHYTRTNLTVTIPSAIGCNLKVRIKGNFEWTTSTGYYFSGNTNAQPIDITIPAGQVSGTLSNQDCLQYTIWKNNPANWQKLEENYTIQPQVTIPTCTQPLGCHITITGTTVVKPSLIGATNGSITAHISGATGSSYQFRLNGGIAQSSPTFSNLAAGTYQLLVTEGACFNSVTVVVGAGAYNTSDFSVVEPAKLVASENPIMLTLGSAFFDGTSNIQYSTTNLTVQSGITNNYKMHFNLISPIAYTVDFYAKDLPNKNTYFLSNTLRDTAGNFVKSNNNNDIAASLAQALETDIVIGAAYFVNVNNNVVTLKAKTPSSRFDLDYTDITTSKADGTVVTTGVTVSLVQSGTNPYEANIIDNYRFYAELYAPNKNLEYGSTLSSSQFNRITELQLPFTNDNEQKFNFSEICKSFVLTPKPNYELSGFTTVTTYMQPYFIKYGELYPLIPNTPTAKKKQKGTTGYIWVANAALDFEQPNVMTGYTGQTISGYLRNVPFLTNSPQTKRASRRQRELLYFIVPQNLNQGTLAVKGDIIFWDGTTLASQTFITITTNSINFGGAFQINVSFDVLGLPAIESSNNKLIKQLNIAVYSGTGTSRNVTTVKSYVYDLEEKTNRVGLSWLNKLGTFDTFDFVGQSEASTDRTSKSYTLARDINIDGSVDDGFKYNASYDVHTTKKLTVNSGWIDSQTFDWLGEIVNSNEIYIYSEVHDNYVNITGFKYTKSSNDTLYNIQLELSETIYENNISV